MSALEQLKAIQDKIDFLNDDLEIQKLEIHEAEVKIDDMQTEVDAKEVVLSDLEAKISLVKEYSAEDLKSEQELFNTLLVKFTSSGTLTKEDLEIYAAGRGICTDDVFSIPDEPSADEEYAIDSGPSDTIVRT